MPYGQMIFDEGDNSSCPDNVLLDLRNSQVCQEPFPLTKEERLIRPFLVTRAIAKSGEESGAFLD